MHTHARDSTVGGNTQEQVYVRCNMCLDTACVSKATNWWEMPIVSIWGASTYPVRGHIVGIVGKGADKVYYDKRVCRHSIYRGVFEEEHSSGRVGENQCDVRRRPAEAKSDAL